MVTGCAKRESFEKQTTITFACVYSSTDAGIKIIKESLDEFEKSNHEIKIKRLWLSQNFSQYSQKILTMIAGGTPPDIFRMAPDMLPQFIQKEVLLLLDEYIRKPGRKAKRINNLISDSVRE